MFKNCLFAYFISNNQITLHDERNRCKDDVYVGLQSGCINTAENHVIKTNENPYTRMNEKKMKVKLQMQVYHENPCFCFVQMSTHNPPIIITTNDKDNMSKRKKYRPFYVILHQVWIHKTNVVSSFLLLEEIVYMYIYIIGAFRTTATFMFDNLEFIKTIQ